MKIAGRFKAGTGPLDLTDETPNSWLFGLMKSGCYRREERKDLSSDTAPSSLKVMLIPGAQFI